ncbi:MAG: DUF4160 domain-containing protein [Proteobacteria bacterium]|nr:DUF4160 domain-containing protein [Pseudomonadota bacterium]
MPELSRFLGIVIRMYSREHNPPHFQAYYGEYEASFSIEPLDLIEGKLPPRIHGLVIEWASMHIKELKDNWDKLQKGQIFKKIDPLV